MGDRLKIARKHAGLSQDELGEQASCGQGVVSKIERGDQEKSAYVVQLAVACGVRPEWLAMEDGDMMADVKYGTDPLINRVVAAMHYMEEEDERYLVITSEALAKKRELETHQQQTSENGQLESAQESDRKPAKKPEESPPLDTPHNLKIRRFRSVPKPTRVKPRSTPAVNSKLERGKK